MKVKSESEVTQSCPTLSGPMDCSLPGSSVHGIFQARVLEWGAIAFSGFHMRYLGFWDPFRLLLEEANLLKGTAAAAAKLLQLCLTLCDPIDSSPPGSPVPGILQARTLEWVAISFSNARK